MMASWQRPGEEGSQRSIIDLLTRFLAITFLLQNLNIIFMLNRSPLPTPLLDTSIILSASTSNHAQKSQQTKPNLRKNRDQKERIKRFAYIFLMAGCDPKMKEKYVGYVLNIIISKYILKRSGSKADVIVLTRMSSDTEDETIPEEELLQKSGVIVRYLPKVHTDNFYSAMLDKFQILKYTEYERIIFLDSDITPFCNLDYIFYYSIGRNAIFAPNVVLSYKREPAQGGFFMLHPEEGDYERLQEIIEHRMQSSYNFSETYGWGHRIEPPDGWDSMKDKNQTKWDWYGAYADQGLLYHWVKYEKSDLTIIHHDRLQRWAEVKSDDQPILGPIPVTEVPKPHRHKYIGIVEKTTDMIKSCGGSSMKLKRDYHIAYHAPYNDFHHFTGSNKPWLAWRRPDNVKEQLKTIKDPNKLKDVTIWWYYWLDKVNEEYKLGLDIEKYKAGRPGLGLQGPKDYMYNYIDKQREIAGNTTAGTKTKRTRHHHHRM